jgi:hypothetical protein
MNYLKMLCIAAFAVVAAMAFASPALATFATSPAGTVYTGTLKGESEGFIRWHTSILVIECKGTMEGKIEVHGAGVTGKGQATAFTYKECNGNTTIQTLKKGTMEIHNAGSGVGTITSTGTEGKAIIHSMGVECIYTTNNTHLGVITDSSITKGTATLDLSATIPRTGGSFFCGNTATLTGVATVTTPDQIFID